MEKTCSKCKKLLPIESFCKDNKSANGYQSHCKLCKWVWIKNYYETGKGQKKYKKSPEKYLEYYYKNKVTLNFARRMRKSLRCHKDGHHWERLVEYTLPELKQHLESQFVEGMTWDNYGIVWHIDHKRPIASFDITDYSCSDFKECWSLKNLQPLFKKDNLQKSDKWTDSSSKMGDK